MYLWRAIDQNGEVLDVLVQAKWDKRAAPLRRPMMINEKLLTPVDVANRLQVDERTVTQWLRKGRLRGFKVGKEWRISPDDLQAFLEASANMPPDKSRSIA